VIFEGVVVSSLAKKEIETGNFIGILGVCFERRKDGNFIGNLYDCWNLGTC
jgi:hypothetical protein